MFKMDPPLFLTGTGAELEENQSSEILPDLQPDDKFTDETQAVLDYLASKAATEAGAEKEEKEIKKFK